MARMEDEIKELTANAEFDQSAAGMVSVALAIFTYLGTLVKAGFPPVQAFRLTRDYHMLMLSKSLWPDTPPRLGDDK